MQTKQTQPEPIKILKKNINPITVAKYYLKVEFFKLFGSNSEGIVNTVSDTIENLSESKTWALLEAMSFTYHLNGVFHNISRKNYVWNEEVWHIEDLMFTGMDSKTNKVIFSKEINGDVLKFKEYLLKYFKNASTDDPEGLMSYKPSNTKIQFEKLIMKERGEKILMIDGSHRLVEMLLSDKDEVTAYVGHPISEKDNEQIIVRAGKSIFILLTILFKRGNKNEKDAILTVMKQLINTSTDGYENAVQYWIERQRDEEIKSAGVEVLRPKA